MGRYKNPTCWSPKRQVSVVKIATETFSDKKLSRDVPKSFILSTCQRTFFFFRIHCVRVQWKPQFQCAPLPPQKKHDLQKSYSGTINVKFSHCNFEVLLYLSLFMSEDSILKFCSVRQKIFQAVSDSSLYTEVQTKGEYISNIKLSKLE